MYVYAPRANEVIFLQTCTCSHCVNTLCVAFAVHVPVEKIIVVRGVLRVQQEGDW